MTRNQLQYHANREIARSNLAREAETKRSNLANEAETFRSNFAKETETNRSNLAKEHENLRSNIAKEVETRRSNLAKEAETNRSNLASEDINRTQSNAKAGYYDARKFGELSKAAQTFTETPTNAVSKLQTIGIAPKYPAVRDIADTFGLVGKLFKSIL